MGSDERANRTGTSVGEAFFEAIRGSRSRVIPLDAAFLRREFFEPLFPNGTEEEWVAFRRAANRSFECLSALTAGTKWIKRAA